MYLFVSEDKQRVEIRNTEMDQSSQSLPTSSNPMMDDFSSGSNQSTKSERIRRSIAEHLPKLRKKHEEHFPVIASTRHLYDNDDNTTNKEKKKSEKEKEWTREKLESSDKESLRYEPTTTSRRLGRLLPWYEVGTGHELDQYNFWLTPSVLMCCIFVAISLCFRNPRLLYGVVGVLLSEATTVLFKWIDYVDGNEKLQECIRIDKKYMDIVRLNFSAFLDQKEKHRRRKITTATVLRNSKKEKDVLTNYFKRRNAAIKKSMIEEAGGFHA